MPKIGGAKIGAGKTFAKGFWVSQTCDNSLAEFPSGTDFSWGNLQLTIDNVNEDNFVEIKVFDTTLKELKSFKFTTGGKKQIDLSQFNEISSTQDIKIRIDITALT